MLPNIRFDEEAEQFLMFDDLNRFHQNKNKLDFDAINADIDALDHHYDDEITDITSLLDTFVFVSLTKNVEENGLRVEYQTLLTGEEGWSLRTKRFNADNTYTEECKAAGSDTWGDCE